MSGLLVASARIWRVVPGHKPTIYAAGFATISDLAFQGPDLLVLELGALVRVRPNGSRTIVAGRGLVGPTGLAVAHGAVYVSNYGLFPGTGPGPHGEVIRIAARG